jgi:predicted MPP superfamily phosphohydrolase
MTGKGDLIQQGLKQPQKLLAHGEKKTNAEEKLTAQLEKPYETGIWLGNHALDVEKKNLLHITKTMTNLWKSCGFVNHVTNNGIKNF